MREKLIEILRVPIYPHLDADPAEVVADYLLDNGVTVQKWISVKDRLPERWQNVLAIRTDGKIRFDFIGSLGVWYEDYNYVGAPVTHWMPLPEPPKGE